MATTLPVSNSTPRAVKKPKQAQFVSLDGRIRVEDWAKLPETKPHYELIDGVLKQKMPTRNKHAYAASRLMMLLSFWGDGKGWIFLTEGGGVTADGFNGFVPDMMGFTPETPPLPDEIYANSPYVVAEVASPSTKKVDRETKMRGYARAEIQIYLLVDSDAKTFEVYRLENEKYGAPEILKENDIWQPAELPGLALELSKLWM